MNRTQSNSHIVSIKNCNHPQIEWIFQRNGKIVCARCERTIGTYDANLKYGRE